jgi:hypothetical protein
MAIISVCIASLLLAMANLFMRKSVDAGGTAKAYLALQMIVSFLLAILMGPVKANSYAINGPIVLFGLFAGLVLMALSSSIGKAIEKGPSGLTFAILSSAAVFPGLAMAIVFGSAHGFVYTPWHAIGSLLVLIGLFWAGLVVTDAKARQNEAAKMRTWLLLVLAMFMLHILILILFHWRGLLLTCDHVEDVTCLFTAEQIQSEWFLPMMYLVSMSCQIAIFYKTEKRPPNKKEWWYGIGGGICNCLCTVCLLYSTRVAVGLENAVIFPIYSIGAIVFSNLWSQWLYREKINWLACQVSVLGILIGSVDWKLLFSFLGY